MSWEQVVSHGRKARHGKQWDTVPAIAITHSGMTLNAPAVSAFGLSIGKLVAVLIDVERRRIGLKVPTCVEEQAGCYSVTSNGNNSHATAKVGCAAAAKAMPDVCGYAYRLHMNPGERVIEASLTQDNRTR